MINSKKIYKTTHYPFSLERDATLLYPLSLGERVGVRGY